MDKINVLTPNIYNLIAAGEVVERPCSAVKELVENSIDSGADCITVQIENGGLELISVTDNGCGIDADDVELAFVEHATSKISLASDLEAIQTLGFRGEALPSIAAVSRIALTTRTRNADVGVRVSVEGGKVVDKKFVAANIGTCIEVRDLYANTPARKKYIKKESSEAAEITKYIAKLILTNPYLKITYICDGRVVYSSSGEGKYSALFTVYGLAGVSNVIEISHQSELIRIEGYIGTPKYAQPNRNGQTLSVNGRYIIDQSISGAITQAYKPRLMTKQYPFYVLNVDIPFDMVDVNVHPRKTEVRFAEQRKICALFYNEVRKALNEYDEKYSKSVFAGETKVEEEEKPVSCTMEQFVEVFNRLDENGELEIMNRDQAKDVIAIEDTTWETDKEIALREIGAQLEREVSVASVRANLGLKPIDDIKHPPVTVRPINKETAPPQLSEEDSLFERARILGVAFKTYLILEIDDKVIFVDQHAAHERLLFDKFMQNKSNEMQSSLIPYTFTVTDEENLFLEENMQNILEAGIELQPFGHNTYRIIAVSTILIDLQMKEFVDFLLSSIEEFKVDDRTLIVETIAKKACKSAVKAGNTLNEYEIKYILKEVYNNKILQCPHGRPITVELTRAQIEKMFKRT